MTNPSVSVLMPAFNSRLTLRRAVASIRNQSMENWELIIVDDGSSDGTLQIAHELAAEDARIHAIAAVHQGRGGARNVAVEASSADIIVHCDSDDLYFPDALANLQIAMNADPEVSLVSPQWVLYRSERPGGWFIREYPATHESIVDHIDRHVMLVRVCAHRRSTVAEVGPFDPACESLEDWDFAQRCRNTGLKFGTVPGPLFVYRHDLVGSLLGHLNYQRAARENQRRWNGEGSGERSMLERTAFDMRSLVRYPGHVVRDYLFHPGMTRLKAADWDASWPPPASLR